MKEKQERFAREYIVDLNATAAAKRAGYSQKTAYSAGHALLKNPDVKKKISEFQHDLQKRTEITAEKVIQELAAIGFSNIQDFIRDDNKPENLKRLQRRKGSSVHSVKVVETETEMDNGRIYKRTSTSFKLHDKVRALENLGKHLGIFEKDNLQAAGKVVITIKPKSK